MSAVNSAISEQSPTGFCSPAIQRWRLWLHGLTLAFAADHPETGALVAYSINALTLIELTQYIAIEQFAKTAMTQG